MKLLVIFLCAALICLMVPLSCFAEDAIGGAGRNMRGYYVSDPRINTHSLQSLSGDVVFTDYEMRQGAFQITGKLSTLDDIDKVLISEDGGNIWHELARDYNISYSFIPLADKRYKVVLKLKTTDFEEEILDIFPTINSICYRSVPYNDLIMETLKNIAGAYEMENIGLFSRYISSAYLGNRTFLEEGVRFDFDMFFDIHLIIYVSRIEKKGDMFTAETTWNKTQTPRITGIPQLTTGKTTFTFVMEGGKMRIKNLRGNLIYATLSPEIAEASGLSNSVVAAIKTAKSQRIPVQPGAGTIVGSGGIATVKQGSITPLAGPIARSFNFTSGTEVASGLGDIDFTGTAINANGSAQLQDVTASATFDNLNEVPLSGYGTSIAGADGLVIAFRTRGGLYGKMKVTSFSFTKLTFDYALQTDGSRNVKTK